MEDRGDVGGEGRNFEVDLGDVPALDKIVGSIGDADYDGDGGVLERGPLSKTIASAIISGCYSDLEGPTYSKLEQWYATTGSNTADLMSQLGGANGFFLVHVESLILRFSVMPQLRSDVLDAPQSLRLVFFVEKFLHTLTDCGGLVRLLFFDAYEPLLKLYGPSLWTIREAFLLQCQTTSSPVEFVVFKSWSDPQFLQHVREWQPPFILLEDGAALPRPPTPDEDEGEGEEEKEEGTEKDEESEAEKQATARRRDEVLALPFSLMVASAALNLHVALMFDIERKGRKVHAFVITPNAVARMHPLDEESQLMLARVIKGTLEERVQEEGDKEKANVGGIPYRSVEALLNSWNSVRDVAALKSEVGDREGDGDAVEEHKKRFVLGFRDILIGLFIKENAAVSEEDDEDVETNRQLVIFFGKVLLLASYLSRELPLECRALSSFSTEKDEWEFLSTAGPLTEFFMGEVSLILRSLVEEKLLRRGGSQIKEGGEGSSDDVELDVILTEMNTPRDAADLFDSRLVNTLLILVAQEAEKAQGDSQWSVPASYFGLPPQVEASFNALLREVGGLAEEDASMFPFNLTPLAEQLEGSLQLTPKVCQPLSPPGLLPIDNEFVGRFQTTWGRPGYQYCQLPSTQLEDIKPDLGTGYWGDFERGRMWQPGVLIDYMRNYLDNKDTHNTYDDFIENMGFLKYYGGARKAEMIRRKKLQIHQRGAARVNDLVKSLGGLANMHHAIVVDRSGNHVWAVAERKCKEEGTATEGSTPSGKELKDSKSRTAIATDVSLTGGGGAKKLSSKAEAILKKNEEIAHLKAVKADEERLKGMLETIKGIGSKAVEPDVFLAKTLDLLAGYYRITEEFGTFSAVASLLQLATSQLTALISVAETLRASLVRKFGDTIIKTEHQKENLHNLMCFGFRFVHEVYGQYERLIGPAEIKVLQMLLISMGFVKSAENLFQSWSAYQLRESSKSKAAAVTPSGATKGGEKGGKGGKGKEEKADKGNKKAGKQVSPSALIAEARVDPASVPKSDFLVPAESEAEVQLKFMGHQMARTLGSAPDSRVRFKPDSWQKRLLDVIDEKRSALVCAPTGCGKTFACYYAMEKALSYDDTSVVVFVCPSKALVNQVSAEIAGRFRSKDYPHACKSILTGQMLREFQDKPLNCQILLILPFMLEPLLMSSDKECRAWIKRLKFLILDEIHCIGESDEEGRAWERLVQLMPCPFLALSATVGNPGSFASWLQLAHVSGSLPPRPDGKAALEVIQFHERYADLSYYVFSSRKNAILDAASDGTPASGSGSQQLTKSNSTVVTGAVNATVSTSLYPINPFICLTYKQVVRQGIPPDFYVPSADLVRAYHLLRARLIVLPTEDFTPTLKREIEIFINMLQPKEYFVGCRAITKRQYRCWLANFKSALGIFISEGVLDEARFEQYVLSLRDSQPIEKGGGKILKGTVWDPRILTTSDQQASSPSPASPPALDASAPVASGTSVALDDVLDAPRVGTSYSDVDHLLSFVRHIQCLGLLPSIMFNFDRHIVELLYESLVAKLEADQHQKYYGTPAAAARTRALNKERQETYRAQLKDREMFSKMKGMKRSQRLTQTGDREVGKEVDEELEDPIGPPPEDIATEYDEQFNLSNRHAWIVHEDEIDRVIEEGSKKKWGTHLRLEGLRRGIGYHHSGLPLRYRRAVEDLFRRGVLRIVFSTETLALGVNMPCKSAVFLGDSLALTPLLFRQTSGRAGRRGFDTLGHIVFWEMSFSKMRRLLSAQLPILSGEFPVNPTIVLRIFQTLQKVKEQQDTELAEMRYLKKAEEHIAEKERQFEADFAELNTTLSRVCKDPLFAVAHRDAQHSDNQATVRLRLVMRYAFRFAVDVLRRSCLVDMDGDCDGLAGLVSLLFESEPRNDLLNWLLLIGVIHSWLRKADEEGGSPEGKEEERVAFRQGKSQSIRLLTIALSYCFSTVKLNYSVHTWYKLNEEKVRGLTCPLMEPLPADFLDVLDKQNHAALNNIVGYVRALSARRVFDKNDYTLPHTLVAFDLPAQSAAGSAKVESASAEYSKPSSPLLTLLSKMKVPMIARSPFAGLCGRDDNDFSTAEELTLSVRPHVYLELSMIPTARVNFVDIKDQKRPLLSGFVLRFLETRRLYPSAMATGIDANVSYVVANDFANSLRLMEMYLDSSFRSRGLADKHALENPDLDEASADSEYEEESEAEDWEELEGAAPKPLRKIRRPKVKAEPIAVEAKEIESTARNAEDDLFYRVLSATLGEFRDGLSQEAA